MSKIRSSTQLTIDADLDAGGFKITNLDDPASAQDAATKAYADSAGGGISPTIVDVKGDLIAATAADTVARLAAGANGKVLSADSAQTTGLAWVSQTGLPTGTSFPGSPATNDLYFRTDLGSIFRYDGTRWLSVHEYTLPLSRVGDSTEPATATKNAEYWEPVLEAIYITDFIVGFFVASGGTALGASHKWVVELTVWNSAGTQGSVIGTVNINSGSSAVFRALAATGVNTATAATDTIVSANITKTGTPGSLYQKPRLLYRRIAT